MTQPRLQDYSRLVPYPVRRKLLSLLDGYHRGEGAGSSQEFLDMAEYRVGDDIADIDWKATARLSQPVVKRFEATAVLSVVIAADTGAQMAALAPDGRPKKDTERELVRALSWLVSSHGDLLGLVAGNAAGVEKLPARAGVAHAEALLREATAASVSGAPSDLALVLRQVEIGRRRSVIYVITDESQINERTAALMRRLSSRHQVGLFLIDDLDPTKASSHTGVRDVTAGPVPSFVAGNDDIQAQWSLFRQARAARVDRLLSSLPLRYGRLAGTEDVLPALIEVLGGNRRGA